MIRTYDGMPAIMVDIRFSVLIRLEYGHQTLNFTPGKTSSTDLIVKNSPFRLRRTNI